LILFGSVGSGRGTSDSDLDLAYLSDQPVDDIALTADIIRYTHWNNVDVVNLHRADPVLTMQIASKGKVLFALPSQFAEFCSLAFRKFVDTKKLRDAARRRLDQFEESYESS